MAERAQRVKAKAEADADELVEPLGHDAVLLGLCAAARAGRLAHALEFLGPAGVGKFAVARWFAAALLCERGPARGGVADRPCLDCSACTRVAAGSHADLFVVDVRQEAEKERSEELRIGRFVPRDEARRTYWSGPTVEDFLGLRAAAGGWRIVIVREAERINSEAQNSLLKSLEEPAPNVLWILETAHPDELLPTIHSRAIAVRFERLEVELAARIAVERGAPSAEAAELARWSDGSPGAALKMHEQRALELRTLVLGALRGAAPSSVASAAIWELDAAFDGKTERAQQRAKARRVLDIALELARDRERARAGLGAAALPHGSVLGEIAACGAFATPGATRLAIELLLESRSDLDSNVDPATVLERTLARLAPAAPQRARA